MSDIILLLVVIFIISAVITGPAGLLTAIANRQWQSFLMLLCPLLTVVYLIVDKIVNNHDGKQFRLDRIDAAHASLIYGFVQISLITSVLWICRREGLKPAILMGHSSFVITLIISFSMGMGPNDWL